MPPQRSKALGSTYRLQLPGLGFDGARQQVPYLHRLGIETLYVSPILAAVPGSTHGYDVTDPTVLNSELGTYEAFQALLEELGAHGMRLLVDAVPNHMATDIHNRWWWDVQKFGQASEFADVFDIDWNQHGGRVLIPTLPAPLAEYLLKGQVAVSELTNETVLLIGEQQFPLDPSTLTFRRDIEDLLSRQHYRPAFWRLGRYEGNYRRFFDIDGLVGVRVEVPEVRDRTHQFLFSLVEDERIAGLRIDHIDGLANPQEYLQWLSASLANLRPSPVALLIEKILNGTETLPSGWDADGTTGYEFAAMAGGLFVDPEGAKQLHATIEEITGEAATFDTLAQEGKRQVLSSSFQGPLTQLCDLVAALLADISPASDLALADVRQALTEMVVQLPVYRTYLEGAQSTLSAQTTVRECVAAASAALDTEGRRAADMIRDVLLRSLTDDHRSIEIAERWEQLTGAVMAKGAEDTATYRFPGLLSHAEVGSNPDTAACSIHDFYAFSNERGKQYPVALNATSTHDSKRGEDTRARLYALSEAADEWAELVHSWRHRHSAVVDAEAVPSPFDELLIYQTLAGIWPNGRDNLMPGDWERVAAYVVKAAREAKRRTTWVDPDEAYENGLRAFVAGLGDSSGLEFRHELRTFVELIASGSATNGLGLVVLKSVCPGVPDFYQGTEFWTATLTDPDNRRPVDFGLRHQVLETNDRSNLSMDGWEDGRVKLLVTRALLRCRMEHPLLFSQGSYDRLEVQGPLGDHVVALQRRQGQDSLIALVPRLMAKHLNRAQFPIGPVWAGTRISLPSGSPGRWVDILTGKSVDLTARAFEVGSLLTQLPVAVLLASLDS